MHLHIPSLLVVLAAAVVAPLVGELTRRIGLSIVVLELAMGVPSALRVSGGPRRKAQ